MILIRAAGGRPAPDRIWQECFAQLVGTILSLWDASELDKVGGDTEVLPTFINLTDAAIHMVSQILLLFRRLECSNRFTDAFHGAG